MISHKNEQTAGGQLSFRRFCLWAEFPLGWRDLRGSSHTRKPRVEDSGERITGAFSGGVREVLMPLIRIAINGP